MCSAGKLFVRSRKKHSFIKIRLKFQPRILPNSLLTSALLRSPPRIQEVNQSLVVANTECKGAMADSTFLLLVHNVSPSLLVSKALIPPSKTRAHRLPSARWPLTASSSALHVPSPLIHHLSILSTSLPGLGCVSWYLRHYTKRTGTSIDASTERWMVERA